MRFRTTTKLAAALSVGALALTACGDTDTDADGEASNGELHIVYTPFDEGVAATYLWQHIFEEQGYDVTLTLMDPGPAYAGVGQDDADLYMASNPGTHRDYVEEYSSGFEFVSVWYEPLRHALVVPDYVYEEGTQTISDLQGRADEFGGQIGLCSFEGGARV